jgi:hypothetical protein
MTASAVKQTHVIYKKIEKKQHFFGWKKQFDFLNRLCYFLGNIEVSPRRNGVE